jgi:hypothetical protein
MKYRVALPVRSRMSSLALLVVLGVAACGGDGDAITATTTTTSGAAGNGPGGQGGSVGANGGEGGAGANGGAGGVAGECGNDVVDDGEECDGTSDCNPDCTLIDDADADGISDEDEGASAGTDSDGDLTPDYQDSDSDDDGIPDSVEAGDGDIGSPPIDSDGDTVPDYADTDSDDDGILDAVEAGPSPATPLDSDGDFTPDYRDVDADNDDLSDADEVAAGTQPLDPDSDGDTISDGDEGTVDSDGDLTIDALDVDSDGDGHLDSAEAGDGDWQTLPADTDFDGIPDFVDLDSEQDGLPDIQEVDCPALGYDGRLWEDSDFDGYPDLAEALVGSDPCDDMENVHDLGVEFFFILPYMGLEQTAPLRFDPTVKEADVFFNVDTTGSMGGEIANLKSGLNTIISETTSRVSYPAFGVASWEDWPVNPYGSSAFADRPFTLLQGVTTDTAAITTGVNALATGDGNDFPEAGYESLYQVGNGSGVFGTGGNFGPFTTAGRIGGARFRPGALPIVFHITDALSHDASIPSTYAGCTSWTPDYPAAYNDHNQAQALAALTAIGARVITVQTLYPAGTCNTPVNNGITGQTRLPDGDGSRQPGTLALRHQHLLQRHHRQRQHLRAPLHHRRERLGPHQRGHRRHRRDHQVHHLQRVLGRARRRQRRHRRHQPLPQPRGGQRARRHLQAAGRARAELHAGADPGHVQQRRLQRRLQRLRGRLEPRDPGGREALLHRRGAEQHRPRGPRAAALPGLHRHRRRHDGRRPRHPGGRHHRARGPRRRRRLTPCRPVASRRGAI